MVFDYFAFARAKKNQADLAKTDPQHPVLNHEDEQFLDKVASHDGNDAPLPPATITSIDGASTAAVDDANSIALPTATAAEASTLSHAPTAQMQKRTWASYVPSAPSLPSMPAMPAMPAMPSVPSLPSMPAWRSKTKSKEQLATSSTDTAVTAAETTDIKVDEKVEAADDKAEDTQADAYPPGVKVTESVKLDQAKKDEDEKEVSVLLDRLNLSSINNRVFSFSQESQKVYQDFTLVLKDMINGAPTAYEDMEKLLKDNDKQLREMFGNMPPFVRTLVKSLPAKLGTTLGPEMLAAASDKPGADMKARMAAASSSSAPSSSKKQKRSLPSVKGLASEQGAVAGMLRSIVAFLKARFPAFVTGTNVIMSIAVFLLLFVFWYCHKRGKETRLQREADASFTEAEEEKDEEEESEESEESEEAEEEDEGSKQVEELLAKKEASAATAQRMQDVLNQPAPVEVPLPKESVEAKGV